MDEDFAPAGRTVDIELGGQEVITIDLDNLDPDPQDVLDLLKEGECKVWIWTKLAGEYWRRGFLESAEKITSAGINAFRQIGNEDALSPLLALRANLQLSHARRAPKIRLPDATEDILPPEQKTKEEYFTEATGYMNRSLDMLTNTAAGGQLSFLTRGILQLDTRSFDEAMRSFDQVLSSKPTNIVALLGKARIFYARRNYSQALQTFQLVLRYNPNCQPDPRIGIGLCFWAMDNRERAKVAWQRSLELNPSEWAAQLLLGLESMNSSKDVSQSDSERTQAFLTGTKLIESAFKLNQKNASAANALCELFIQKGTHKRAMKLAERTTQFADTLTVLTEGHIRSARIAHAEGNTTLATKQYTLAAEKQPKHHIAAIGFAQMQMKNDEFAGAIHTLDTLLQPPNAQKCNEAVAMLASLRIFPRAGVSSTDIDKEKVKARELFDRIKVLETDDSRANGHTGPKLTKALTEDAFLYIEIAKLWQTENLGRTSKALREALRVSEVAQTVDPRIMNNLGALYHLEEKYQEARSMYEKALTTVSSMSSDDVEATSTSILYNLARVYEDQGDDVLAKEAYDKLLSRHPEYNDAKIRQAQLLCNINRNNEAHEILKQALTAQPGNPNLRAFYTYFLAQSNLHKLAKDFVFGTLKDHGRHDIYALCAAAWIQYHQSRESRDGTPEGIKERKKGFQRSAEFYEKALSLDPYCAFAAQGLAIITAEDALGSLAGGPQSADEMQRRPQNARDALDIFAKVRESISDGSVYMNMGHCHYARDEFDRAIESYETASVRFYKGQNIPVLLCLCRCWYAKAMKDQSYTAICKGLEYAQKALHLQPNDKAILYNIAMIQQKSAEMLFSIKPEKRKLVDLQRVIDQATHAQRLFASLASDPAPILPYSRDIADNRRKYGDNMLKKGDDQLAVQKKFEQEIQTRLDVARTKRQEEKEKQEALERERMETLRLEAERLAEDRRHAREQAMVWTREVKMDSDDEKEKKPKKTRRPKPESAAVSGDEAEPPKKKRRGKLKKAGGEQIEEEEEEAAVFTDDEDADRVAKKRTKKRVVRDDDEEEASAPSRKKQYKSKEVLSDTDEEMD